MEIERSREQDLATALLMSDGVTEGMVHEFEDNLVRSVLLGVPLARTVQLTFSLAAARS